MRFSVLASGSGGNACYIETPNAGILVDAGLSCRETIRRLRLLDVAPESIQALVVTHEHVDHIRGAGPFARRFDIPVYINQSTLKRGIRTLGNLSKPMPVHPGQAININDLVIETFTKCHDAVDPVGLTVSSDGIRLGFITDVGRKTRLIEDRLAGCQALIIEFNHDVGMLDQGPYPLALKRRVKGPDGHLSNVQAGELLRVICHKTLSVVILAHISTTNNLPQKALETARDILVECGLADTRILISEQDCPLPMVEI